MNHEEGVDNAEHYLNVYHRFMNLKKQRGATKLDVKLLSFAIWLTRQVVGKVFSKRLNALFSILDFCGKFLKI